MHGFLSRVVGIILAFLMLVVAPLLNTYGTQEMENRMETLNDVSEFLDKVTDKGEISEDDLNEFYLAAESHGMTLDVKVERLVKTATLLDDGTVSTAYIVAEDYSNLNVGDIVKVELKELSTTPYKKLLNTFLRIEKRTYELDMAKMVK